ncbi:NUDIX domain-containing protein [Demequina sp. NBRC 110057]|uniref:NUDIX domain-containing protein n=1 Tax=Demequina sp. NBRC 110057 TaxID=1570346 RepID=UPI0027D8BA55|nr:NUDIX domain-containing protein [Demequina sp. NBRC 110057]
MTSDDSGTAHAGHLGDDDTDATVTSRSLRGPRLSAHRDAGDAWVVAPDGTRYWGRFGAAGLVVHDPGRGVLLQHRASWSHHGDTWGVPGGALHEAEAAFAGACREAAEEADVPAALLEPVASVVLDRGVWRYTTVIARATSPFEARAADAESHELRWVPIDEVDSLPLHPGFGAAWELLRSVIGLPRIAVVVDVANVVGSVPDGWWRDRRGAAERLIHRLALWSEAGDDLLDEQAPTVQGPWDEALAIASSKGLALEAAATLIAVVEGEARGALAPNIGEERRGALEVVAAAGAGDDAIVDRVRALTGAFLGGASTPGSSVVVVTSDRELRRRVEAAGAVTVGTRWLLDRLPPS